MITMKLDGLDDALRSLNKLDDATAGRHLKTAAMAGIMPIQNAAKQNALKKSGTLARSIHSEVVSEKSKSIEVATGTDVVYAAIHEFGGPIVPKSANALYFEIEGHMVVTQRVEIPARPYMRPAFDENTGRAEVEVRDSLQILVKQATR